MSRVAAAAATALALIISSPASAHGPADARILWETPVLQPAASGISVEVAPPVLPHVPPLVVVRNTTAMDLTVLDPSGTPFLRAGSKETFGNVRSPFLGPALNPQAPAAPSPGGPAPLWKKLPGGNSLRWYEARAAYAGHSPADPNVASILQSWIVTGTLGATPVRIVGEIRWKPLLGAIQPAIVGVTPRDSRIEVRVLPGPVPGIQLRNESARTIEITGRDDRPFARIGPHGVAINVNSATYRDTRSLPGATSAEVEFENQPQTLLVWLERRAAYQGEAPAEVQSGGRRVTLKRWNIPGTIDGAPFEISGTTDWVPIARPSAVKASRDSLPVWVIAGFVAGGAIIFGAARALRRSRPSV